MSRIDRPTPARTPARTLANPRTLGRLLVSLALISALITACAGDDKGDAGETTGGTTNATTGTGASATVGESDATTTTTTTAATTSSTSDGSGTETSSGSGSDTDTATDAGGDPVLEALCLEVQGSIDAGLAGDCQCAVEAGESPSVDACLMDKGIGPGFSACRCDVVAKAPDMAPFLECLKPVAADFAACIAGLGCDDPDALDNCYFVFLSASDCPPSITAVDAEVEFMCRGAEPFACGSGEEIPDTWLCDLDEDCADGSDESRCPVFMCDTGDEIPLDWQCDGAADCPNGDDEVGCPP